MKDRLGYEYLPIVQGHLKNRTRLESPARQAKKELGLSSRQYVKQRKALRRKPKVEFTGPKLVDNLGGLVT